MRSQRRSTELVFVIANNEKMICWEYKQSNSVTERQSQNNEDLTLSVCLSKKSIAEGLLVCLSKKMYRRRKLGFVERKYLMESPDLGIG